MTDEVIVGVTCLICGKIICTSNTDRKCHYSCSIMNGEFITKYLDKAYDNRSISRCKSTIKATKKYSHQKITYSAGERRKIGNEYIKKINPVLYHNKKLERVGTFDTCNAYGPQNKMCRDKKGNPDWKKESEEVQKIKKKTFNSSKNTKKFSPTEGDKIRNTEYVENY